MAVVRSGFSSGPHPIYFDDIRPATGSWKATLLLLPGGAHTGACYLATADGRPGWAHDFVQRGFRAVATDWPGVGRSGAIEPPTQDGQAICQAYGKLLEEQDGPLVVLSHSMSGPYGWKLLEQHSERIAALVGVAPGPPGNIQKQARQVARSGDVVTIEQSGLPAFASTMTLDLGKPVRLDPVVLRRKLIGSSTQFPPHLIDAYSRTLTTVPPRLIYERMNTDGSQLKVADPGRFAGKPMLVVSGEFDLDHPREVDGALVKWLAGCGARSRALYLPDQGMHGNGHMMMLEQNSREIALLIADWIEAVLRDV